MNSRILILGGYGNTGRPLAKLLLRHTNADIIIAGRRAEKASGFAGELAAEFNPDRISHKLVDAASTASLTEAFHDADMVAVTSSTNKFSRNIIDAAIDSRIDYIDVNISSEKISYLKSKELEIKDSGLCFITDGGFHPGLPAAMIRFAGEYFDKIETAIVSSLIKIDWRELEFSPGTETELMSELADFKSSLYEKGEWRKAKSGDYKKFQFQPTFGARYCTPMELEEMKSLPGLIPGLQNTGFYVSGFNPVADFIMIAGMYVFLPIFGKKSAGFVGKLFKWGLRNFSRPPFRVILQLEAEGLINGIPNKKSFSLYHDDGYFLTAAPVAACLAQYLGDDSIPKGVHLQAVAVEPLKFMRELSEMGIVFEGDFKEEITVK